MRKEDVEQWISDNKLKNILHCKYYEGLNRWAVIFISIGVIICSGETTENSEIYCGRRFRRQKNNSLKNIILTSIDLHIINPSLNKLKLSMLKNIINNIEEE